MSDTLSDDMMEAVLNTGSPNVVWYFQSQEQRRSDNLWQEYVENNG